MKLRTVAVSFLVAALAVAGLAFLTEQPATAGTILASEDTWLEQARPTATHGTDSVLYLRASATAAKWGLVKFVPTETGTAQVRVKFVAVAAGNVSLLVAPSSSWSQTTVNWNTRPLPVGAVLDTKPIPGSASTFVTFNAG